MNEPNTFGNPHEGPPLGLLVAAIILVALALYWVAFLLGKEVGRTEVFRQINASEKSWLADRAFLHEGSNVIAVTAVDSYGGFTGTNELSDP